MQVSSIGDLNLKQKYYGLENICKMKTDVPTQPPPAPLPFAYCFVH